MDTTTGIIIGILVLVIIFLGVTVINSNNSASAGYSGSQSYPQQAYIGGGCGR